MTAKQIRKIFTLNLNFPEPSRKQFLYILCSVITLFGGGNFALNLHNSAQSDTINAKVDSAKVVVDSTSKPKFAMRADLDTVKNELREAIKIFKQHIELANTLIPQVKADHVQDSTDIAYVAFIDTLHYKYLERRMTFVEGTLKRQ